jgi:hypothetical protein
MALSRRRRREGVGLGIQFTPTIQFGFLVFENFGFPNYSNRSVLQKTKTELNVCFIINRLHEPSYVLVCSFLFEKPQPNNFRT